MLLEWVDGLRKYEQKHRCVIFPPIESSQFYACKDEWVEHAIKAFSDPVYMIPTLVLHHGDEKDAWHHAVVKFFGVEKAERLVFKRSLSGRGHHVRLDVACEIGKVHNCFRVHKLFLIFEYQLKKLPMELSGNKKLSFAYLVQPFVDYFEKSSELRLYIVNGEFLFGGNCLGFYF
jgi:hypothetical protein